jgi:hypothetical protein
MPRRILKKHDPQKENIMMGVCRIVMVLTLVSVSALGAEPSPPHWIKMPLLTPEQKAAGIFPGGEGSQWPRGPVAVSPANPEFLLLPIDVGGVYRSLDGGAHWEIAMVGWNARGANGFAIDPGNARHAIGIAANSQNWTDRSNPSPEGLYQTTNQASSWNQVLELDGAFGGQVQFDPNSYNPGRQCCETAYYLSGEELLYYSDDGGATWTNLKQAPKPGIHPAAAWDLGLGRENRPRMALNLQNGYLYLGGENGLFRSADHGRTWTDILSAKVHSLAVSTDGKIYVSDPRKLYVSANDDRVWQPLVATGLDTKGDRWIQDLVISPADPQRMLCWLSGAGFNWPRFYSQDPGGSSIQTTEHSNFSLETASAIGPRSRISSSS